MPTCQTHAQFCPKQSPNNKTHITVFCQFIPYMYIYTICVHWHNLHNNWKYTANQDFHGAWKCLGNMKNQNGSMTNHTVYENKHT